MISRTDGDDSPETSSQPSSERSDQFREGPVFERGLLVSVRLVGGLCQAGDVLPHRLVSGERATLQAVASLDPDEIGKE